MRPRLPPFWSSAAALVLVWALLEWGIPHLGRWLTDGGRPLPVPGVLRVIYLALALVGVLVHSSVSDESLRELFGPVRALLRGPSPGRRHRRLLALARLGVLVAVPILAGGAVWRWTAPAVASPTMLRIQHPTLPGAYERLHNPVREPSDEAVRAWLAARKMAVSIEEGRRAFQHAALLEGRVIFQMNCRPCHGDAADGAGPMARGFRLKPVDFTDPGTIATVVEAHAFWRVTEGGPGLPPEATPWDSAMPAWKSDLSDDQKWKAILAAYDLASVEPRKPEKLGARISTAWAQGAPAGQQGELSRGRAIYQKRCEACHGEKGDGQGPVAPYLDPRPRDFVTASFKFRTTLSGEPPTDDDLLGVLARGIPGTAMPAWPALSVEEGRLVIAYIKRFSDVFKETASVVTPGREPAASAPLIARGKEVYRNAKCWECHGDSGRGDGPAAATLEDDPGDRIRAADLTKGWRIKGGREARDIFMRFSTGLDGTPMPSYADTLSEEDRWALAHYVRSLQTAEEPGEPVVLRARRARGAAPGDPDDPRWAEAPALAIPLSGQVIAPPRWQNPSVDAVTVRAYYDAQAIAFLLEWNDPFEDAAHEPGPPPAPGEWTYPRIDLRGARNGKLRDAVRLEFPSGPAHGFVRPHFLLGEPGKPVALWHWQADRDQAAATAVIEERAEGFQKPVQPRPEDAQHVTGRGTWKGGRWKIVMRRTLVPAGARGDVAFEPGRLIPFAVHAWDGSNGEQGLMMSLSSWNYIVLEVPVPLAVYVWSLLGVALTGLLEWRLIRGARRAAAA